MIPPGEFWRARAGVERGRAGAAAGPCEAACPLCAQQGRARSGGVGPGASTTGTSMDILSAVGAIRSQANFCSVERPVTFSPSPPFPLRAPTRPPTVLNAPSTKAAARFGPPPPLAPPPAPAPTAPAASEAFGSGGVSLAASALGAAVLAASGSGSKGTSRRRPAGSRTIAAGRPHCAPECVGCHKIKKQIVSRDLPPPPQAPLG
jgi:hypothetical protein